MTAGRLPNGLQYFVITGDEQRIALGINAGQLHEEDGQRGVAILVPDVLVHSITWNDPNDHEPRTRADTDISEIVLSQVHDPNRDLARMRAWIGADLTERAFAEVKRPEPKDLSGDNLVRFSGTRHPWRGTKDDVRHLDIAKLRQFRQRWYVPSRMTLVVSGPWKRDEVVAVIEQNFSTLQDKPSPPDPKLIEGPRDIVVAPGCCYLFVSFLRESPPPRTRDEMRADLIRKLFERALLERLRSAAKVWGSNAQRIIGGEEWLSRRVVSFELTLVTNVPKELSAAFIARELERVRLHGFTADELRRAREPERPPPPGIVVDYFYPDQHCINPVERTIRGSLPISCDAEKKLRLELLPTISDEDISALRSTVDPRTAAFGAFSSERGSATAPSIKMAIDHALARPITRWTDLPPLMETRPKPGRVVRESRIPDGVELWLTNGAHVRFHSSSAERVTIHASSAGGALAAAAADIPAMANVAEMVNVAGLGVHDGTSTHRILEHHEIELSTVIGLRYEHVRGSAPPDAVEQLFQALHLAMTADRVNAYSTAVTYERQTEREKLVRATLPPHLVADLGVGGDLKPSVEHALELYRERFGNAGDFTFDVSGPIELARARDLSVTYIGSLKDDGRRESVPPLEVLPKRTELSVRIDPRYSCVVHMFWTMPAKPLSGPPDEGLLWSTIVDQFVGDSVGASATRRDDLGYALHVQAFYDCADPQHIDETAIRDRLAQLSARTFTANDVARIRESYAFPQPSAGPDVVREAQAITAGHMSRVVTKFQPPNEVLIVREVH